MDRGALWATVMGPPRIGHDWAPNTIATTDFPIQSWASSQSIKLSYSFSVPKAGSTYIWKQLNIFLHELNWTAASA